MHYPKPVNTCLLVAHPATSRFENDTKAQWSQIAMHWISFRGAKQLVFTKLSQEMDTYIEKATCACGWIV